VGYGGCCGIGMGWEGVGGGRDRNGKKVEELIKASIVDTVLETLK